ncbi:MAG: Dual-specificity RNA methyltransferase RlmN [Deltaproteobacteria bacterium ADurb.Bin510]|nr:MAG: Dual-specificity RNA methyltransferase RlmN [Deltaproteobacteria bacterium ADurb.Bin510]
MQTNQPEISSAEPVRERVNLLDLDRAGMAELINDKPYRAAQVFEWVFGRYAETIAEMTNLSKVLRAELDQKAEIRYPTLAGHQISLDGTEKFAYRLHDGHVIESVLIPDEDHATICVSSQVGCAMGCRFCYTGTLGFKRNLAVGEIMAQVLLPRKLYPKRNIRNIVFMGMGEPMLNFDNVIRSIAAITDQRGPDFSYRRVTVSTCGVIPGVTRLGRESRVSLAVSLNATTDEQRSQIMPINRKYPLKELMQALRDFELPKRRRITLEYVLLGGFNDSLADARRLIKLAGGLNAKVNLIPFNAWPGSDLKSPEPKNVMAFEQCLMDSPVTVMLRREKGSDILAACGQLAGGINAGTD